MSDETNNGAGNGAGNDDDKARTEEQFEKKYGRHSRFLYAMDEADAATLKAAAAVLNNKLVPEILKHFDCGEGPGKCGIYDPDIVASFMSMTAWLILLAESWEEVRDQDKNGRGRMEGMFGNIDSDDIPDFVKEVVADFAAGMGGSGDVQIMSIGRRRRQGEPNNFTGHRHGPNKKGDFNA